MIILALLILLSIVCGYSWVTCRIKTTKPEIVVTVPKAYEPGVRTSGGPEVIVPLRRGSDGRLGVGGA